MFDCMPRNYAQVIIYKVQRQAEGEGEKEREVNSTKTSVKRIRCDTAL